MSASTAPVSYTHLVGMEIAVMQSHIVKAQVVAQRMDVHFADALGIVAPVSYTHLDVYKRQVYYGIFSQKIFVPDKQFLKSRCTSQFC